jgi:hypothetical protein
MKTPLVVAALALAALVQAQDWRQGILSLPENPNAASPADMARFNEYLQAAGPYFAVLKPGDWEANREIVRRMAAYSATLGVLSRSDPQMRAAYGGVQRSLGSIRFPQAYYGAYPGLVVAPVQQQRPADEPAPAPRRTSSSDVPFLMNAPDPGKVKDSERATAKAVETRYENAAAQAAGAWQNIDSVRQNLESRGMTLNTQTAAAAARLPLLFQFASQAISRHDWEEANLNLERAEGETQNILRTVGR